MTGTNFTKGKMRTHTYVPFQMIETKEYLCARCGYKWIAGKYGIDKPKPKFCPKCKTWLWDKKPISESDVVAKDPNDDYFKYKNLMYDKDLKRYRFRNSGLKAEKAVQ